MSKTKNNELITYGETSNLMLTVRKHYVAVWIMEHYRILLWELILLSSSSGVFLQAT